MRNLLIMLSLFLLSSFVSASQTFYYYKKNTTTCAMDYTPWCQSMLPATTPTHVYTQTECGFHAGYGDPQFYWTDETRQNASSPITSTSTSHATIASKYSKVCADNEKMELNGCTATCVIDPCLAKVGLEFSKKVSCGVEICPNGGHIIDTGTALACDKGLAQWTASPTNNVVNLSCNASIKDGFIPTNPTVIQEQALGASSAIAYCDATFVYVGSHGDGDTPTPSGLVSLSYTGVTPTTENGQCPTGTTKGQFGTDGQWVCVPDSGLPPTTCTAPQVKDIDGVCKDPAPVACPTGQVKDVTGVCVAAPTTPPPPAPEVPNQPNVSHGSGPLGSTSSGSSGTGTQPAGTNGTGSGSQSGAGSNTGSFTPTACQTEPTCAGDPLGCAALLQDFRQNCAMMTITDQEATQANDLGKASNDELIASQTTKGNQISALFNDFKSRAAVSSNSLCPADLQLSVMSHSMNIPFSQACSFFKFLRLLVIMSAYFYASRVVFGSLS